MLNFGVSDLVLVRALPVDETTRQRAVHAQGVLNAARHADSLASVRQEFEVVVGFAARYSTLDKAHLRQSEPLEATARRLGGIGGRVALVFGREDFGLSNEDVETCDFLCTIPTSPAYRSMNLSHAISVALYEITRETHAQMPYVSMATPHEKQVLFTTWSHLQATLGFKVHRVEQGDIMFQRLVGRAGLTSWDYHRLMGVLSRSLKTLKAWPPPGLPGGRYTERETDDEPPRP